MSNAVCPQCGSLRTRTVRGNPLQQIVAAVRGQTVIVCGRCGWKGRQFRLPERSDAPVTGDPAADDRLDYQALDRAMSPGADVPRQTGRRS